MTDEQKRKGEHIQIQKSILATILYFDIFDYPMTLFELWRYAINLRTLSGSQQTLTAYTLSQISKELADLLTEKKVETKQGFYFLPGRCDLVTRRIQSMKFSQKKIRSLRSLVRWLRFVPFVRMIGVTGRLALGNAQEGSDWDVFIVLKQGAIWRGRTLVTGFLHSIGKRRHGKKTANRVCLNAFVTDESLEISPKDLFAAREYSLLIPLFGKETFQKFQISNRWIQNFFPNWTPAQETSPLCVESTAFSRSVQALLEWVFSFSFLEGWLRSWQQKKIQANPKTHLPESYILANDNALIFLPKPQGPEVFEVFQKRLRGIM